MLCLLQLLLWWIRFWRNGYLWLSSLVGYIWLQRCRYFIVRGLEIFAVLWYNSNSKKATSERNLWFAWGGIKYGVWIATTFLTIYGFGLCGISVNKSTRKQWFQIQKYQKSLKSPYFTRLLRFGSVWPPHEPTAESSQNLRFSRISSLFRRRVFRQKTFDHRFDHLHDHNLITIGV